MIVDLGAGENPDPRASTTVDINSEADIEADLSERWPFEDSSVSGLVANHVVEHLDSDHVFREAARVLVDGGWFEVTVPLGEDASTDPDHVQEWTFGTPARYCRVRQEPWDEATAFELEHRDVDAWLGGPLAPLTPVLQWLGRKHPGWLARRCYAGELTARFRRVSR